MAGKFTAKTVSALTAPGRYHDGGGLYFQVRSATNRSWLYRFTLNKRAREMGLGPFTDKPEGQGIGLAEARQRVADARKLLAQGIDPLDQREADQRARSAEMERQRRAEAERIAGLRTFKSVAEEYIAAHRDSWRNSKHRAQWTSTLESYAFPIIGSTPVGEVDQSAVLKVLSPIWRTKPETAGRVRGRIEAVLDYAKALGWRSGENAALWRGNLSHALPARRKLPKGKVRHHPALPWQRIPEFMPALRDEPGTAARALEFVILTATRTSETLNATWREFDLDGAVWSIPAERMKGGRPHRVALSEAAISLLKAQHPDKRKQTDLVFPGRGVDKPLSIMAMSMLVRRMNEGDAPKWIDQNGAAIVPHGFRSTFRDWAGEATAHAREVVESALAHALRDKTEAAYARGDQFVKRAVLMTDWASWCAKPATGEVVALVNHQRSARKLSTQSS